MGDGNEYDDACTALLKLEHVMRDESSAQSEAIYAIRLSLIRWRLDYYDAVQRHKATPPTGAGEGSPR